MTSGSCARDCIDGTYELQKGLDHTKHIWMRTTKPVMYLRWATTWRQWIFDNGESRAFEILLSLSRVRMGRRHQT